MNSTKIKSIISLLVLIIIFTLNTGCDLLPGSETETSSSDNVSYDTTPIDPQGSIPISESQGPILPSIADVVAKVKPSVVAINTEITSLDIFNRPYIQEGAGSGWIIRDDGIVITNNHVVEGAQSITVTLDDSRTFPVVSVFTDPLSDLAVLKINAQDLPTATVGNSSTLRVGNWVVAIGNSLGQGIRATQGIVSRQDVSLEVGQGQTLYGLIETDAAINPGNSGGPLVNMSGEVIGITSVKIAQVGVEGVGYGISSNEATPIIEDLITTGYVVRPWLGVSLYTVDDYVIQRYELAVDKGAFIVSVATGSPSDKAGLKAGDVITSFDGKEITTLDELIRAIHLSQVSQTVDIVFWHGNVRKSATVILAESPPPS